MYKLFEIKDRKAVINTKLHTVGRANSDSDLRNRLRMQAAVLVAKHIADTDDSIPVNILIEPDFFKEGRCRASQDTLWFCTYIGYENVTSKWAKSKGYSCVICIRLVEIDIAWKERQAHTVQLYY